MTPAEFDKGSPEVESHAHRSARMTRKRWANLPQYPHADAWQVASYLISGVLLYGLLGYGAARWSGIPWLTGVGIVIGGVLGIWLTYIRYGRPQSGSSVEASAAMARDATEQAPDLPRASAPLPSRSAERPSGPPPSDDPTAEEEKP